MIRKSYISFIFTFRYSPEKSALVAKLLRELSFASNKSIIATTTIGIIEYCKLKGYLSKSFKIRHYQRKHNIQRIKVIRNIAQKTFTR